MISPDFIPHSVCGRRPRDRPLLKYDDEEDFKRHERSCQSVSSDLTADQSGSNMDLVITAGDRAYPASRRALAEQSGYFSQLLSQLPREQTQLVLPDMVPSEYLALLLASTASEECLAAALTQANAYQMLLYAQLLQMPRAAAQCRAFIAELQQQMLQVYQSQILAVQQQQQQQQAPILLNQLLQQHRTAAAADQLSPLSPAAATTPAENRRETVSKVLKPQHQPSFAATLLQQSPPKSRILEPSAVGRRPGEAIGSAGPRGTSNKIGSDVAAAEGSAGSSSILSAAAATSSNPLMFPPFYPPTWRMPSSSEEDASKENVERLRNEEAQTNERGEEMVRMKERLKW